LNILEEFSLFNLIINDFEERKRLIKEALNTFCNSPSKDKYITDNPNYFHIEVEDYEIPMYISIGTENNDLGKDMFLSYFEQIDFAQGKKL